MTITTIQNIEITIAPLDIIFLVKDKNTYSVHLSGESIYQVSIDEYEKLKKQVFK